MAQLGIIEGCYPTVTADGANFFLKEGNQKLEGKDSKKGTQFSAWFCRKQYYRLIREKHWEKEKTLIINFKLFSWNFCCILSIAEVFYK